MWTFWNRVLCEKPKHNNWKKESVLFWFDFISWPPLNLDKQTCSASGSVSSCLVFRSPTFHFLNFYKTISQFTYTKVTKILCVSFYVFVAKDEERYCVQCSWASRSIASSFELNDKKKELSLFKYNVLFPTWKSNTNFLSIRSARIYLNHTLVK